MDLRRLLLFAILFAAFPLRAREKSDVIVMRNGDKITCEVKGLSSNTLFISVDYILNTLSVDWSKVDHIESKQLFIVRMQDGTLHTGTISAPKTPAGRPSQIEVLEISEQSVLLERKKVVNVAETSGHLWQRLNGELALGFTHTKGNQTSQYNLSSDINYLEERWSAGANYSSNLSSSSGTNVSTRNELSLSGQRYLRWENWYYTGIADFLQSSVLGIQRQYSFGGGIGRNIVNTDSTFFTVYGGFAWQQINYQQMVVPAQTQQVTAGLIGTQFRAFRFNRTTLNVSANLLPAVSDLGRLHFNLNSSYYVKLWGKLNWNFTLYGNWDNRPPPGFAASDYGTSSGLSWSFGNH